jgi:hypothetical protein
MAQRPGDFQIEKIKVIYEAYFVSNNFLIGPVIIVCVPLNRLFNFAHTFLADPENVNSNFKLTQNSNSVSRSFAALELAELLQGLVQLRGEVDVRLVQLLDVLEQAEDLRLQVIEPLIILLHVLLEERARILLVLLLDEAAFVRGGARFLR